MSIDKLMYKMYLNELEIPAGMSKYLSNNVR